MLHSADMAQHDVTAYFPLLESTEKRTHDEVKALIHENLHSTRDPTIVNHLVEYYMTTQSAASVDILVGLREPHEKALFDKLNDFMRGSNNQLSVLTLLGYIVRKQPSWLHKIVQHQLTASIIRCLKQDMDVPVLMSACLIVSTLLPVVPVGFGHYLHDVFLIFARLASFSVKKPPNVPDVFLLHLQVGVYALFHRLYGMYPCGFLAFLRTHYSKKENIVVFDQIVKPMLERVRVHPLLITGSKDMEVSTKRWKRMEIHDIVIECAKLSLDTIEGTLDGDVRAFLPFGGLGTNVDLLAASAPTTPGPDAGHQFFSSSYVNEIGHSWPLTKGAPQLPPGALGPLYHADDNWTPSHSCGLHSPPNEVASQNDSDFVHISPLPSQGTPSSNSHSFSSAPTTPADHPNTEIETHVSPSKRHRRKTVPIVSSKTLPYMEEPNVALRKRLSLESQQQEDFKKDHHLIRSDSQGCQLTRTESLGERSSRCTSSRSESSHGHHLAKSDSLGLLTGGYRADDKSGSGSRTPDPGQHRDESLPSVQETSLSSANDDSEALVATGLESIQKSCELLTAQSAALFIRNVTRTRYTSMTLVDDHDPRNSDTTLKNRCRSVPSLLSQTDESKEEIATPKLELSPRRISQSSTDLPNSPVEESPEMKKPAEEEQWNRPRLPYEDLFPSALPYAPISQCQRCLDRSYAVPDYSAPVELHRGHNNSSRVLGLEIPLFSTLAPTELLDRHLVLSADLHPSPEMTSSPTKPPTSPSPSTSGQPETLSTLRAQVHQLHAQLMYERHRREQHAVRNRRLLGKITRTAAVEEQNSARKEQLTLQESEIKYLQTALDSLRYEYNQYKEKQKEHDRSLHEELSDVREKNEELLYKNTQLKSELAVKDQEHVKLLNEFKILKSDSFEQRQELEKARRQLSRHSALVEQVSGLNKELLLMGELQNKYKEHLANMETKNGRFSEHAQLLAPYKNEITGLRATNKSMGVQLEATTNRIRELEEQISQKERSITEQKRAAEVLKSAHLCDLDSVEWRNRSLQKVVQRLEQEILDLFSKLHQQRHDEKGRSRMKASSGVAPTPDQSSSHPILIDSPPPDHVTQFTPDVSTSLSPHSAPHTSAPAPRTAQPSNEPTRPSNVDGRHSNADGRHSNEAFSSDDANVQRSRSSSENRDQVDSLPSRRTKFCSDVAATSARSSEHKISASIPTSNNANRKPEVHSQNHSFPTILPVNFDYTAWRSELPATSRPKTLDYDHDARHEDGATSSQGGTGAGLVDSGLHESKSE